MSLMLERAKKRTSFGQALVNNIVVKQQIADSCCNIEAARNIVMTAARAADGRNQTSKKRAVSDSKVSVPRITLEGINLLHICGYGYISPEGLWSRHMHIYAIRKAEFRASFAPCKVRKVSSASVNASNDFMPTLAPALKKRCGYLFGIE